MKFLFYLFCVLVSYNSLRMSYFMNTRFGNVSRYASPKRVENVLKFCCKLEDNHILKRAIETFDSPEAFNIVLEKTKDINLNRAPSTESILETAIRVNNVYALRHLLAKGAKIDSTIFYRVKSSFIAKKLVNADGIIPKDIILKLIKINTCYPKAIKTDFYYTIALAEECENIDIWEFHSLLDFYIKQGIDINKKDAEGKTALHLLLNNNYLKKDNEIKESILKLFLENGANPNLKDKDGFTPLMAPRLSKNAIALLLGHGAKYNIKNKYGRTAITYQIDPYDFRILIEAGASLITKDNAGVEAATYIENNIDEFVDNALKRTDDEKRKKKLIEWKNQSIEWLIDMANLMQILEKRK